MPKKKTPQAPKNEAELQEVFDKQVEALLNMGARRAESLGEGWTLHGCIAMPPRVEIPATNVAPRDLIEYTNEQQTVSGLVATITVDPALGVVAYTFERWPGHYPPVVLMVPIEATVTRIG